MRKILLLSSMMIVGLLLTAQNQIIAPAVTQVEGQGNGGRFLYMSDESRDAIMSGVPWKVQNVKYYNGSGPVLVKVIDPLQIHNEYDYLLRILPVPDAYDSSLISNDAHWQLEVLNSYGNVIQTIVSQHTIGEGVEEEISGHGISVTVKNQPFVMDKELEKTISLYPNVTYNKCMKYAKPAFLGSMISYSGEHHWLSGIADEEINVKNNWIRAGHHYLGYWDDWGGDGEQIGAEADYRKWRQEDYFSLYHTIDGNNRIFQDYYGQYENILGGTWAPYPLASAYDNGPQAKYICLDDPNNTSAAGPIPAYYDFSLLASANYTPGYNATLNNLYSVDVVLTPDRDLWTRAIVLEAGAADAENSYQVTQYFNGQIYHNVRHEPKNCPSVDKDGNPDNSGTTGMGWFPGYAINVETGERLNIMFSENSEDEVNNGADMIFNPTSDTAHWGGCHFVYICGSTGNTCSNYYRNSNRARNYNDDGLLVTSHSVQHGGQIPGTGFAYYDCGPYDEGAWLRAKFNTFVDDTNYAWWARRQLKMQLFNNVMWTSIAMPAPGEETHWLSNEATVRIRVSRPFMFYSSAVGVGPDNPQNNNAPVYQFNMRNLEPIAELGVYQVDKEDVDVIDVNDIEAKISPVGMHFYSTNAEDGNKQHYYVPKDSRIGTYLAQDLWLGGLDENDQLHLAATRFGGQGKDFWPGPLSVMDASVDEATTCQWDRCFKISREEVIEFRANRNMPGYVIPKHILEWPAHGDTTKGQQYNLAPYVDVDHDNHYDPQHGDYPSFPGDMALFFIFNDNYAAHTETGGTPIGLEVHGMAYAFNNPGDSLLNNTLFFNYKMYNRSAQPLHNAVLGLWSDWDLGYACDDYVGCDVRKGTAYCYNGVENDPQYGSNTPIQTLTVLAGPTLPADGVDNPAFYDGADCALYVGNDLNQYAINGANFGNGIADDERVGMTGFMYHDNDNTVVGDPSIAVEYYYMLQGAWKDNTKMKYGGRAHSSNGGNGPDCRFMFPGNTDPCNWGTNGIQPDSAYQYGTDGWTDPAAGYAPYDRRGLAIVGPFNFGAGTMQELDFCLSTIFPSFTNGGNADVATLLGFVDTLRNGYAAGNYTLNSSEPITVTTNVSVCEGDSYSFFGENISEAGTYWHVVRNSSGTQIDTAYLLNLTVVPSHQLIYAAVLPNHSYNDAYFNISSAQTSTSGVKIIQKYVYSQEGCPTHIVLYLDVRTDVGLDDHLQIEDFALYPNPTTGLVYIQLEDEALLNGKEMLELYDLSGRLLQNVSVASKTLTINLSEYASGLYIVKIGRKLCKIVKR